MASQFPELGFTMDDYAKGAIALACTAGVAIFNAFKKGGYKPVLLGASLAAVVNLAVGVHLSYSGHPYPTVAFVNFCACFVPMVIAIVHGGEFNPELAKSIYQALP